MRQHHYTKTEIETVAAAVNAGVCLEDGSSANNILSLAGEAIKGVIIDYNCCLLYTSPSPRDATLSRMPSSA